MAEIVNYMASWALALVHSGVKVTHKYVVGDMSGCDKFADFLCGIHTLKKIWHRSYI